MRAIDADAFKEYITGACEDMKHLFNDGGAVAKLITESFCKDIDEQPTIQPEPHWIPVTERLPKEPFGCLVTVMDTNPMTMEDFENILPYFVGWDGEQWNDGDGQQCPFEVIAWIPLPEPYKGVNT